RLSDTSGLEAPQKHSEATSHESECRVHFPRKALQDTFSTGCSYLRSLHRGLYFTFPYPIRKLKQHRRMLFYPLLLTERSYISGQDSRQTAKSSKKLFRQRLDIFLWNGIGQKKLKQYLICICSVIFSHKVRLEPFPMTSFTF